MKVWILGGFGLLGSALQRSCRKVGVPYVASGKEEADITRIAHLRERANKIQPSHIVNCAAYTNVDRAEEEREQAFRINAEGPYNVGVVAREMGAKVTQISTDYVFDGSGRTPYLETDRCAPHGVYAESKWEGEKNLLLAFPAACIIRSSWVFGVSGKNFISSMLELMRTKVELKVVADQCGRPTFCEDLAQTIVALLNHSGIFHFANEGPVSRYQMALAILQELKKRGEKVVCQKIIPVTSEEFVTLAKRPSYSVLDTTKISCLLGSRPRKWTEALQELLSYVT